MTIHKMNGRSFKISNSIGGLLAIGIGIWADNGDLFASFADMVLYVSAFL